jgi:hypothetical protein
MTNIEEKKYLTDREGRLVPIELVKPVDLMRDELVREACAKAKAAQSDLRRALQGVVNDIDQFVNLSTEQYGAKVGGNKGNYTLYSYDGSLKIVVSRHDFIRFDERLKAAESLIGECLNEWGEGARPELIVLIKDAFVQDKEGKIRTDKILRLRQFDFRDEKWQQAMAAIADSIQIERSKTYWRFYVRDKDGAYNAIELDASKVLTAADAGEVQE